MSEQSYAKMPEKGDEAFLSPEERKFLQRFLSFPEDLPPKFRSYLEDFIKVNARITTSQIEGFEQFKTNVATTILTSESTSSVSYTDLATVGPQLTDLGDGTYIIQFGCQTTNIAAGEPVVISISVNGATASDDDSCVVEGNVGNATTMRAVAKELRAGGSNTITVKYRVNAGTADILRRWLIATKIGN